MAVVKIAGKKGFSGAGQYFDDHLASGDYHDQEGKSPGQWIGKGAEELGLKGVVQREDFMALCENLHPRTGNTLTARMNTTREGGVSNRRAFYDIGFAPPKSISIAALVHGDERIIAAHNVAVKRSVEEVFEPLASANVRSKNDPDYGKGPRQTGNLTAAVFQHDTSRSTAAGAAPDPQLHSHVVVMNATKDVDSWKALETHEMHQAQKLAASTYDHYLIEQLHEMGYSIREARDGSWELAHINEDTIAKFSGRNIQIKERAEELKAAGVEGSMDQLKANAANFDRVKKDGSLTTEGLREVWRGEMTAAELNPVIGERNYSTNITAEDSVKWAKLHCFERSAVVSKNQFLDAAMKHVRGAAGVTKADVEEAFRADEELLRGEKGKISTKEVLDRENFIVNSVISGKEKYEPLAPGFCDGAEKMNPMQMDAAQRIISSKDFVTVFRGGAGTGKSFALEHVKNALEGAGRTVTILAPQNKQVEGLKNDGLDAQTLSKFLNSKEEITAGSVIICDESGQIAGKEMAELLAKAKLANARVILSGDIRQHGAVGASDALIGICKYAAPRVAEIAGEEAIMRQKVDWYRSAVYAADQGDPVTSFAMLEKQGVVIETGEEARASAAAAIAEEKIEDGSILVLTQTNYEVDALNDAIRGQKISLGQLDKSTEIEFESLQAVDLTNAAKQMAGNYKESSVIVPNQARLPGFKPGDTATFLREGNKGSIFVLVAGKREVEISPENLEKITVCEPKDLALCKGDQIQLKANVSLGGGRKLANGSVYSFEGLDKVGCVMVKDDNGKIHSLKDCRQIKLGYAVTSYSGQGMTVDHVIISDSSNEFATSKKEFYVSISRGRQGISILTSDKEGLREHVEKLGDRELAMDLMAEKAEADTAVRREVAVEKPPYLVPAVGAEEVAAIEAKGVTPTAPLAPAAEVKEPIQPYLVPAVSQEEVAAIQAESPSNVIPFPDSSAPLGEEKPASENAGVVGDVDDKAVEITEKSIESAKESIQSQQPAEHYLDTGQKIQTFLPKVPGFCGIYEGAGQVIQRASSAVKEAGQQVQEKVAQIFR